jgi:hypothetical protein
VNISNVLRCLVSVFLVVGSELDNVGSSLIGTIGTIAITAIIVVIVH